ncbi:MAG TPA: phytanoyl-CoA dioxygenase family protein [Chloroflexota bacterium]|nr:phytanoyl-CoA dioxygenase family protein [Chloroflexota bacterium]
MPAAQTLARSVINDADKAFFKGNGYLVVRNLLTSEELQILRARSNVLAAPSNGHVERNRAARKEAEERWARTDVAAGGGGMGPDMGTDMMSPSKRVDPNSVPEERLSPEHARRGPYLYNLRTRPVDPAAREAALATDDPFNHVAVSIENLCDMDEVCRSFAANPKIIAVLRELLGPNLKMWYDHLFSKPPFNASGLYGGANRYHQDGFFFSEPSATCWIALDEVTKENGCLRYIPLTAGYGRFPQFDVIAHGIGMRELEQEVLVPLHPGDAVFHDRMTVHGTGPNETGKSRRGWALHYTRAESTWGDFRFDPTAEPYTFVQTSDGLHLRNGRITGNRDYLLVSGQEFPGCV